MKKISQKIKRKIRTRNKLKRNSYGKFRISIFKSSKNFSAQIIDDRNKKTLVSASSVEKDLKKDKINKIEVSNLLGEVLAKRAKEKNISDVYFDRGQNKYHGRIKVFAESLRKNGIKF
tara:strand:- start:248 stop:601 length:354 start_codon:yes stop_codon:yes gene_type:complete